LLTTSGRQRCRRAAARAGSDGRKPKTTGPTARDTGAFKYVLARINTEGRRALKVLAAEQETTLNALAVEAFNDLLKKHGKRQSVENPLLD
jgi:predicted HicB family RNase H-like nuclease